MNFDNQIPEWKNSGTEPSENLKTNGFVGGYRPPAAVFNWFWSKAIKAITELQAKLSDHADNKKNPHDVTKEQVGLGNVNNTSDKDKPISTAVQNALDNHTNNKENPHGVTKKQLGLEEVNNTSDLDKPISNATQEALNAKAPAKDFEIHTQNTAIHVSKDSIGLYVDV